MTRTKLHRTTAVLLAALMLLMQLPFGAAAMEEPQSAEADVSIVSTETEDTVQPEEPTEETENTEETEETEKTEEAEEAEETEETEEAEEAEEPAEAAEAVEAAEAAGEEEAADEADQAAESDEELPDDPQSLYELLHPEDDVAPAEDGVFALLYEDGTLSFQSSNTPEEGKAVKKTYPVDLDNGYAQGNTPWYADRASIRKVNFAAKIAPKTVANWFMGCNKLEEISSVANLDLSEATSMANLFYGCSSLRELNLIVNFKGAWNTAKVTDMSGMLYGCSALKRLDLSTLNTSSVTNLQNALAGCSRLTRTSLLRWNTSNVTNMKGLFRNCSSLQELDLTSCDTSKVTKMDELFSGCSSLETIHTSESFTTDSVTSSEDMFAYCSALKGGSGTVYSVEHMDVTYARNDTPETPGYFSQGVFAVLYEDGTMVFQYGKKTDGRTVYKIYPVDMIAPYAMTGNKATNVDWFEDRERVKKVVFKDKLYPDDVSLWFDQCTNLEEVENPENLDLTRTERMMDLFYGCTNLKKLDVTSWDTSNVNNMHGLFFGCSSLTELDVSGWDTSNVTDLSSTFNGCSGLTVIDVSGFDTSKVDQIGSTFLNCSSVKELDVSNWQTSKMLRFGKTFSGCSSLTTLDLSGWDTSGSIYFGGMFTGCTNLKTIYASDKFVTSGATTELQTTNVFTDCPALVGGNGTTYSAEHTDVTYARIDTPEAPGYFSAKERKDNTIQCSGSFTKTADAQKDQTFQLNASANGAPLSYKSGNNSKVTVDKNGKVTIKKGFVGKITITITSKATKLYLAAEKKITVKVNPSATNLTSVKGAGKKVTVKWKKNNTAKGYELQFSLKNDFRKIEKTVRLKKKTRVTVKGLKKGTYYVRIRTVNGVLTSKWSKAKSVKVG